MHLKTILATATALVGLAGVATAATLTVATVNNNDMIIMQKLSPKWEEQTGNKINWVVLEENVLRQRVTTDIATKGGQFDIVTIGSYEVPIWGKQGWLSPMTDLGANYDLDDVFPAIRGALSAKGTLYALPFYAESSFTMYRKDLFDKAGLTMPDHPTYTQIRDFADKLTDKAHQQYGLCVRGKPGWGENMAYFDTVVNTFGGEWFDMNWKPQLDQKPWLDALTFYVDTMKADGPPGVSSNGYNETRALFATGHCGMWIDATAAAGSLFDKSTSTVSDKVAFTAAPTQVTPNGSAWFWSWSLAVPTTSKEQAAAKSFVTWATSKDYINMVGSTQGWALTPPGTRASTYANANYIAAAPFANATKTAILSADLSKPSINPVPYTGIQYVAIPEFADLGTQVGQMVGGALAGQQTPAETLKQAQAAAVAVMDQAGYTK